MQALPNAAEEALADCVRAIGQKGFESALHRWLRRCVPFDNLIVLAYRDGAAPIIFFRHADAPQVFAELETTYLSGAYLLDPFHDLHLRRVPAGVYRLREIAPDAFHRSRYFRAYYQQTTLIDELAFVAYPVAELCFTICLGRDATSDQMFSARDQETAARLAPIVVAMVESHWGDIAAKPRAPSDLPAQLVAAARAQHGIALSPRQAEVALMILRGHSTVSIGLRLGISAQTVKVFRKQLYARCGITSQAELFALLVPLLSAQS